MAGLTTQKFKPDQHGIDCAARIWREGGLVAFPTETVYGLGADACNGKAVAKVFAAKDRPSFNPLIVHVSDFATAQDYGFFNDLSLLLAQTFWPGPLSLVVPTLKNSGLSDLVTAGLDTVAIRVPEHSLARQLLGSFGGAIAAPSANPSGRISPTTADHVLSGLSGEIDGVIDGGPCVVGLESTILLAEDATLKLLRPGGLPAEAVTAATGLDLITSQNQTTPNSPGQLSSHYSPDVKLVLGQNKRPDSGLWLGFGPDAKGADLNLSPVGDMVEAAANLFAHLRRLDEMADQTGQTLAHVSPIPKRGLGLAINDRLSRAAAPK